VSDDPAGRSVHFIFVNSTLSRSISPSLLTWKSAICARGNKEAYQRILKSAAGGSDEAHRTTPDGATFLI
jgi:hypothetical protein